jgi:uncharacterized protein
MRVNRLLLIRRLMAAAAFAVLTALTLLVSMPSFAQNSPLDLLMQQRRQQQRIIVIDNNPPRRALPNARAQRTPKRVLRARQTDAQSIEAIINESAPEADQSATAPVRQPPLPGLAAAAPVAASPPGAPLAADGPAAEKSILVIGDSLGIQLGQGLREAFADRPDLMIDSRARANTGLVNTQVRDWPAVIKDLSVTLTPKPALVVMMIGANDNQRLPAADGTLAEQLSDPWRDSYAARIDGIVMPLKQARIPLIWVGMPVMKNDRLSGAMLAINGIYQERVEREGLTYLDIWDQFSDAAGGYTSTGPDIAGDIQRIRAGDGVHFTKTGSRKLAFFVEQEIRKALEPSGKDVDLANLPADVNEQIRQENAPQQTPPPTDLNSSLISPEIELPPAFPIKPAAGPIITLTLQPSASQLVPLSETGTLARPTADVLRGGLAPYPKPGRGDDFSWPRQP